MLLWWYLKHIKIEYEISMVSLYLMYWLVNRHCVCVKKPAKINSLGLQDFHFFFKACVKAQV